MQDSPEQTKLSRREFLKRTASGLAGLAAMLAIPDYIVSGTESAEGQHGILPAKYRKQSVVIQSKNNKGEITGVTVGLKVPAGVDIYVPMDGILKYPTPYGIQILADETGTFRYYISGIQFPKGQTIENRVVKKGEVLGQTRTDQQYKLPDGSPFNLAVSAVKLDEKQRDIPAVDVLKRDFPEAFKKPPVDQYFESGVR